MHRLGHAPLDPRELLGVEAELEHVLRLGAAGELGVDDLVGAVGEALDEVGEPAPGAVGERGLVDDVGAVVDGSLGLAGGALPVAVVEVDLGDRAPVRLEPGEVGGLVLVPLAPDEVSVRVVPPGLVELAASDRELERRQVLARQEGVEVGRGEEQAAVAKAHWSLAGDDATGHRRLLFLSEITTRLSA